MVIETRSSLNEPDLRSGRVPEGAEKTAVTFNGSFRNELLNETLLSMLAEACKQIGAWKEDYNRHRPHSSLGNLTPQEFAMKSRLETKAA